MEARPSDEVELLVGSNYIGLQPYRIEANNNIQVLKSMFGSGYLLVGCHSALKSQEPQNPSISHIKVSIRASNLTFKSVRDYLDSNELPVKVPRRCGNFMNCVDCACSGYYMSLREKYNYQLIEDCVTYEEVEKLFRVNYPFTEDPSESISLENLPRKD